MMMSSNTKITEIYDLKIENLHRIFGFDFELHKIDRKEFLLLPNSNYKELRKDYRGSP